MRAVVGEHVEGPLSEFGCGVVCNGCGAMLIAGTAAELAKYAEEKEWQVSSELGGDDLCPDCAAK